MRLSTSVRVALPKSTPVPEAQAPKPADKPAAVPLTQESLEEHWKALMEYLATENPQLHQLLANKPVRLKSDEEFDIVTDSSYYEEGTRPHMVTILEWLRQRTGIPSLNATVVVEAIEREKVIYAPRDKFQAMLETNPTLEKFLSIFPEIDF